MLHLQSCWLNSPNGPRVPFNEVAGNREIALTMRLIAGYIVHYGSKRLESKQVQNCRRRIAEENEEV